ncbi:MAG: hypothetical protein ACLQDQ_08610 [Myxococcaceae bacterium]
MRSTGGGSRVVHLSVVRARSRLTTYQTAIGAVLAANRKTFGRLHASGTLFSPEGVRVGRDLLLAHQHLLRVVALLQRLSARTHLRGPKALARLEGLCLKLDRLLERSSALAERTGTHLGRMAGR